MSGQWIFIQPEDVWMFRDSKPFSAQQAFVARSQFPPNPQTMQGVIRSHYLESQGVNWKDYAAGREDKRIYEVVGHNGIGDTPPTMGRLRIQGPFVAAKRSKSVEILVPAPLDLVYNAEMQQYETLRPDEGVAFSTDLPFSSWRPLIKPDSYEALEGWMSQKQFTAYLNNETLDGELRESVFEFEDRMGLGMNHQRRSNEEGLLYRARFIRPHDDVGLLVHVNQDLFTQESGFIRIGGESRSARFNRLDHFAVPQAGKISRIKVVLLTPAYFSGGYQPDNADWSPWINRGTLVSAVVGKPLAISGWDIAHNRPKPLRHFVPAGSVYFFEGGQLTSQAFTETPSDAADYAAMGFGSVAIGTW